METEQLKKPDQELKLKTNRDGQMMLDTTPPLVLIELTEPSEAEIRACLAPIAANCMKCAEAAKANGIRTGKK